MNAYPKCTLCLFAYKQEKFIRVAVQSAFDQDYPNLEIILSDDCSSDGTYGIMTEMAKSYVGPHKIVLNRNEENLGIGMHVNKVAGLAEGEWLIMAAGDDISLPCRTKRLMQFVDNKSVKGLSSGFATIDESGAFLSNDYPIDLPLIYSDVSFEKSMEDFFRNHEGLITGAVAAWHCDVFKKFSKFPTNLWYEDLVLSCRARLLGQVKFVPEILIKYRNHSNNVCSRNADFYSNRLAVRKSRQRHLLRLASAYRVMSRDVLSVKGECTLVSEISRMAYLSQSLAVYPRIGFIKKISMLSMFLRNINFLKGKRNYIMYVCIVAAFPVCLEPSIMRARNLFRYSH